MQHSDDTLVKEGLRPRRIGLIPREPTLDFGTVKIGEAVSPQRFTVDLAPDTQGLITTDADFLSVEPTTFGKGQTEVTVRLRNEKLQRGQQLQGAITAAITTPVNEQRHVPVRVKVRQYSDADLEKQEQLEKTLALQISLMDDPFAKIQGHLRVLDNESAEQLLAAANERIRVLEQELAREREERLKMEANFKTLQEAARKVYKKNQVQEKQLAAAINLIKEQKKREEESKQELAARAARIEALEGEREIRAPFFAP